jgi:hypothetical protein
MSPSRLRTFALKNPADGGGWMDLWVMVSASAPGTRSTMIDKPATRATQVTDPMYLMALIAARVAGLAIVFTQLPIAEARGWCCVAAVGG